MRVCWCARGDGVTETGEAKSKSGGRKMDSERGKDVKMQYFHVSIYLVIRDDTHTHTHTHSMTMARLSEAQFPSVNPLYS